MVQKPKFSVSDIIVRWQRQGSKTAESQSDWPKQTSERRRRNLKGIVKQNHKSTLVETTQEFQNAYGVRLAAYLSFER